jgi:hypothetical protein
VTNPFGKISSGAASYFKPKEHQNDLALIVEPKEFNGQVPSTYAGQTRYRDEVTSDITVFENTEQLENGTPGKILKDHKVTHGMLTDAIKDQLGGAVVVVVTTTPTKNGSGFVFRELEDQNRIDQAGAYFTKREAALAEAVAAAPSFD